VDALGRLSRRHGHDLLGAKQHHQVTIRGLLSSVARLGADAQGVPALPYLERATQDKVPYREPDPAPFNTINVMRYTTADDRLVQGRATEDVFDGRDTKKARQACPSDLVKVARRKLDQVNQAARLDDLRVPPNNRLEKLRGDREGRHSIRISDQWRVCFMWTDAGAEEVEIVDYHKG
jgi:proteic killer suppression protein